LSLLRNSPIKFQHGWREIDHRDMRTSSSVEWSMFSTTCSKTEHFETAQILRQPMCSTEPSMRIFKRTVWGWKCKRLAGSCETVPRAGIVLKNRRSHNLLLSQFS
jgi:hypothetical protein